MKKRILVAPLNWGIGHACRCIPIINALLEQNFEVVIASDNEALLLLKKEFPKLSFAELPAYNIKYSTTKEAFRRNLIKQLPKIYKAIKAEHTVTQQIIKDFNIDGIISDNRLGVYSKDLQSVFLTHQLNVLTGSTSWISTKLHKYFIRKFDLCWIPDFETSPNLSGKLSHSSAFKKDSKKQFIGALSRFKFKETTHKYDILVLLSGPEPQRSILEKQLLTEFKEYYKPVLFVKGIIENEQKTEALNNITIKNFLTSKNLENALLQSKLVICRSGYTSIMDLAKLRKNAFFIPTPGQFEQEYLAYYLEEQRIAPFCNQDDFNLKKLKEVSKYLGFKDLNFEENLLTKDLFCCFL